MKTIDSLSGVEFENLCQTLLSRMGFYVETTATTGDGGIDLIAYYDKPLLSGKYVIQCKRYSDSVGVAIIRELFGVISDTRANKGILITSSEFTNQAKEYAKDKNIELIDRHKLEALLHEYNLTPDSGTDEIHFDQIDSFPKDKHEFYKDLIARNLCTQDLAEDYLFNFLFNYLSYSVDDTLENIIHINYFGLSQEYLRVFNWYVKKFLSTGKKVQKLLPYYTKKYQGLAQLHNFDLFDYVQARYDELTHFSPLTLSTHLSSNPEQTNYKLCNIPEEKHAEIIDALAHRNYEKVKFLYSTYDYERLNLYCLFSYFGITRGQNYLISKWAPKPSLVDKVAIATMLHPYKYPIIISPKLRIYNGTFGFMGFHASNKEITIESDYSSGTFVDLSFYFDKYKERNKEKIEAEIKKINTLFEILESKSNI